MKLQWHVLTAIPFLLIGAPLGALACVAPDIPWLMGEVKYRQWAGRQRRWGRASSWHHWVESGGIGRVPTWALSLYRLLHSTAILALALVAALINHKLTGAAVPGALFLGWVVHIALDMFTHDGKLALRPFYPFTLWAIPARFILPPYAMNREFGARYTVLLSGGWESAVCMIKASERAARTGAFVYPLFVDYGQPNADRERMAATAIAKMFGCPLRTRKTFRIQALQKPASDGRTVYRDRNMTLCAIASCDVPGGIGHTIYLGYRAPHRVFDEFGDGSPQFAKRMWRTYGYRVVSPVIAWPKWLVRRTVRKTGIPESSIWSSETKK